MTTFRNSPAQARPRVSFARARLLLGISGVGAAVLLALFVLAYRGGIDLGGAGSFASPTQALPTAVSALAVMFLPVMLAFLIFDLIGGVWLVRRPPSLTVWLTQWARGAVLQWVIWTCSAAVLLSVARGSGNRAAIAGIGAFVLIQCLLASQRGRMARAVGALKTVPLSDRLRAAAERAGLDPDRIVCVDVDDEGFVGGWTGIRARTLLVPQRWNQLSDAALVAALVRRRIIGESGAHVRGVIGAIAWNTLGFVAVLLLTRVSLATVSGILAIAAGMTLWAFVGVLLLPTLSRAAVFAVDGAAASVVGATAVRSAIEQLDRWQDDEPTRAPAIEIIFHPVPARTARIARLLNTRSVDAVRAMHLHHVARHALWLGWGSMSPISRAVHCNVGRPALWVMLPGD